MNRLLKRTRDFLFAQQTGIISSTIVISSMLLLARIFGFARYRVLNSYFTKEELDIFYAAFRIPDFVFEILITGALTTTFIPFFLKYESNKEKQAKIISTLINVILLVLVAFMLLLLIFMPYVVKATVLGFDQESLDRVTSLSRILLIGQLPFLVLGNMITGLSQAYKRFLVPSFAPVLYNIGIVVITMLFASQLHIYAVIVGVVVGSSLFLFSQVPLLLALDFTYTPTFFYLSEIKHFFRTITPRLFTVMAAQIEATIDQTLTTLVSPGAFTIFYYAQHLQLLPVSLIGIAFGQASLPYLSEIYQSKKTQAFKDVLIDSITNLLFVTAPIMVFFIVARTPIVRLIFGGQRFDWVGTVTTAETMSYFALSLPFHSCYYFLTRCYYATMDSRTPFIVSVLSILCNALLSYIAVGVLGLPVWSLGLTFSFVIVIQVSVLFLLLSHKLDGVPYVYLFKDGIKICISAALAFIVMYPSQRLLDGLIFDTTRTINLLFLLVTTGTIMIVTYLFASWALDVRGLYIVGRTLMHMRQIRKRVGEMLTVVES